MSLFVQQNHSCCDFSSNESWIILSAIEQSIKRKIEAVGIPLKEWNIKINYGIKTGFNDAFIISTEKREEILSNCIDEDERERTAAIIRPILRGRDLKRYGYNWADLWLINTHNGVKGAIPRIDVNDYPAIKQHLDYYWDSIAARADKGDTPYNLRNCAYLEDLNQPKIVWGEISDRSKFAYDFNGRYSPEATSFLMVGDDLPYLLCVLNSPLAEWFFSKIGTTTGVGTIRWKKYTIQELLIPKASDSIINTIRNDVESYINGSISIQRLAEVSNHKIYEIIGLSTEEIEYVENFYPALLIQ